jgi:hypothetical protein
MDIGDIISLNNERWLVTRVNESLSTALAERYTHVGIQTTVMDLDADNTGVCTVVCNPVLNWPSVQIPSKRGCELVSIEWGATHLEPIRDWVKLDPFQIGGLVYLNPELSLGFRDRLTAVFRVRARGQNISAPFEIPRFFESYTTRQVRQAQKVEVALEQKRTPALYNALIDDQDDEL